MKIFSANLLLALSLLVLPTYQITYPCTYNATTNNCTVITNNDRKWYNFTVSSPSISTINYYNPATTLGNPAYSVEYQTQYLNYSIPVGKKSDSTLTSAQ
jgi:hypothetical protein